MIIVAEKDIPNKENLLGQFFTPDKTVDFCLHKTEIKTNYVIEPSCGTGAFLDKIRQKAPAATILGIELDTDLVYQGEEQVINKNFYDFENVFTEDVCFIGNPPYHSPAYSLSTHTDFVKSLMKKYKLTNIREEAVFFLVHTVDLIIKSNVKGYINYILPKAIFDNNSKAYKAFSKFLQTHLDLISVWDLDSDFIGVNRDLVYVSFETKNGSDGFYLHNGEKRKASNFYNRIDYTPFQDIFKKTNLGSVPCESIFLSVKDEPLEDFRNRLINLFSVESNEDNLISLLSYNGAPNLTALKRGSIEKVKVVLGYIKEIKTLPGYDIELFSDLNNYKPIRHRHDDRVYFRNVVLKKGSFVYEINRDPCPSFYFPGNPNKGSTDYFGFCEYDVNRNSSPGANRTIPINNVEDNLHEGFKAWWDIYSGLPYDRVFDYLLYISQSKWYKNMKKTRQRFYFGIPKEFDEGFLDVHNAGL